MIANVCLSMRFTFKRSFEEDTRCGGGAPKNWKSAELHSFLDPAGENENGVLKELSASSNRIPH
jgi:hypothetical protein